MKKDQTGHQEKADALLQVDALLGELCDKHSIQSFCILVFESGLNDHKFGEWTGQIYGKNKSGILQCAQTSIDNFMKSIKEKKARAKKSRIVPDSRTLRHRKKREVIKNER